MSASLILYIRFRFYLLRLTIHLSSFNFLCLLPEQRRVSKSFRIMLLQISWSPECLSSMDWSEVLTSVKVASALEAWEETFTRVLPVFVPRKKLISRPGNKPWYSSLLHKLARHRDRMFKKFRETPENLKVKAAYQKMRNLNVRELRHAERAFYNLDMASVLSSTPCRLT